MNANTNNSNNSNNNTATISQETFDAMTSEEKAIFVGNNGYDALPFELNMVNWMRHMNRENNRNNVHEALISYFENDLNNAAEIASNRPAPVARASFFSPEYDVEAEEIENTDHLTAEEKATLVAQHGFGAVSEEIDVVKLILAMGDQSTPEANHAGLVRYFES